MAVTSHIPLPPGDKFVGLSKSFLNACEGDRCAALVMWELRYRTDKYGPGVWFEASVKGLVEAIFEEYAVNKVRDALRLVKRLGFVEWRAQEGQSAAFRVNVDAFLEALNSRKAGTDTPSKITRTPPKITDSPPETIGVQASAYKEPRAQRAKKIEEEQAAASSTQLRERVGEPEELPAAAGFKERLNTFWPSVTHGVSARCQSRTEERGYSPSTVADGIAHHGAAVMVELHSRKREKGVNPNPEVFVEIVCDKLDGAHLKSAPPPANVPKAHRELQRSPLDEPECPKCQDMGMEYTDSGAVRRCSCRNKNSAGPELVEAAA